jgi:uncharacterized membrane protein YidH (DUF202 family)
MRRPDPSGSPERTRLAWRRTSLSSTVVAVLLLRLALHHQNRAIAITVSALAAIGWVFSLVVIQHRVHALPRTLASPRPLIATAASCLLLGALGVVLVTL